MTGVKDSEYDLQELTQRVQAVEQSILKKFQTLKGESGPTQD